MQLLTKLFGSRNQSALAFLFPISLMLLILFALHSCGRADHIELSAKEVRALQGGAAAADVAGGSSESAEE